MPLFLLALPHLLDWWRSAWQQSRGIAMVAVVAVVFLIADNAVLLAQLLDWNSWTCVA